MRMLIGVENELLLPIFIVCSELGSQDLGVMK